MCNCALELTLRRRSQFWHSQQPRRTTGSGAGKRSSTPASEPDYSRLQPNADSSAQWTLGCLPHDELTVWTPETSFFPWRGRLHYEPASAAARCLLLGHALRTVVESDSTVRPLTKSSNTTVFCYLLKWIHFFFFFSNSSGTLIFLNRILNRNPIWEG